MKRTGPSESPKPSRPLNVEAIGKLRDKLLSDMRGEGCLTGLLDPTPKQIEEYVVKKLGPQSHKGEDRGGGVGGGRVK